MKKHIQHGENAGLQQAIVYLHPSWGNTTVNVSTNCELRAATHALLVLDKWLIRLRVSGYGLLEYTESTNDELDTQSPIPKST